mgnify:CR=1 FL=1
MKVVLVYPSSGTYRASVRAAKGPAYTATCTMGEAEAARAVVEKYWGKAAAKTVREIRDARELEELGITAERRARRAQFYPFVFDETMKAKKSIVSPPAPEPASQALRPLTEIVAGIGAALEAIAAADHQFQRATLADRVWIGVGCLAASEHHALSASQKGRLGGRGRKAILRVEQLSPDTVHPQGVLAWFSQHIAGVALPTVYKYMAAARGIGLDAWATEAETRALVARWIADFDARETPLTLKMLAEQGKEPPPPPEPPERPSLAQIKYEAITAFTYQAEQLAAVREHLTPEEHDTVATQLANLLHDLTGYEWSPNLEG